MRITFRAPYALPLVMCLAFPVHGQETTGSIAGFVKDVSGAVIPGVTITVQNVGTNASFKGVSNQVGTYTIRTLPVGIYRLAAELPGFKRYEVSNIQLQVNETARVDIVMELGQLTETIEVEAKLVSVNTEDGTLRAVVDQRRVEDLPLNGRDPTQLMQLVAGVSSYQGQGLTSGTTYPGATEVSVNGSRGNATNYVLDGGQNNDHYSNAANPMPNPDALQEFSVQTNNFSAEFGRNSGGIVNAITKSGTNDLHGRAFWYVRHHDLNAAEFFAPASATDPTKKQDDGLKRNQFGATVGGPVMIPGVYNGRDKTFFFFSYQGTRIRRRPTSRFVNVLTAKEREGDFSELGRALKNPFDGGVFPNNKVPASLFFPGTKFFIDNYIPVPTSGRQVTVTQVQNYDDNQYVLKVDQQLGSKIRFYGRGFWARSNQPGNLNPRNYYEMTDIREWRNTSVVGNLEWVISPSLLSQSSFSYNNTEGPASHVYPEKNWNDLGVNITLDDYTQYHMTFQSINGPNTGDTNNFTRDEYHVSETLRWTKGRHSITFGGDYGRGLGDIVNNYRAHGQFRWRNSAPYTGYDVADFLIGKFERLVQGVGEFKNTRFDIMDLFFNDSMKITPRFTLSLGARWEPFFPYTDELGKLAVWGGTGARSTRFVNAPEGVLYPGDSGVPDGGYDTSWGNIGARFGLAYALTGDGKTSLRLGYGIFFDRSNTISTNSQANQGPFGTVVELYGGPNDSMANPYANFPGGNPFKVVGFNAVGTDTLNPPSNVKFVLPHTAFVYSRDMRNPYVQSWNLTLEREVGGSWVTRASYAGSKGTALVSGRDMNAPYPDAKASTATTTQRRPYYPNYGPITIIEPAGLSNYHSMQLTAEKRFSQGFTVMGNYTLGKSIDNNQSSANKATGTSVTDPYNQAFDRGPSDYDVRHVVHFSGIWELPLRFQRGLSQFFLGGWSATTIISIRSGFPFTVGSGVDNARTGQGGQRADLVGDPYFSADRGHGEMVLEYLRRSAFAYNALGTYGTLGRNTFWGPEYFNTDFGFHKSFAMRENMKWQFRFEAFNLFNRVNFRNPTATVSSANFMRITSTASPRILQFALRFEF